MKIKIDEDLKSEDFELLVGYAVVKDVSVNKAQKPLKKLLMEVMHSVKNKYSSRVEMYSSNKIKEMRNLFKYAGVKDNRYTPSAEALLKRIIDGGDLYRINNIVECNNMASMKFELPCGVYDLDKLVGDVTFKLGTNSDIMETMAKGKMNMENILLTKDEEKLFGSPVSDSPHTKISENSKNILLLVYGTSKIGKDYVLDATKYAAEQISTHADGVISGLEVIASK
jgi:DNA/RNA-binding domain of Phe-tRNA-synthetase-like protein